MVDVMGDALAARSEKWLLRILIAKSLIPHTFATCGMVLRLRMHKRNVTLVVNGVTNLPPAS